MKMWLLVSFYLRILTNGVGRHFYNKQNESSWSSLFGTRYTGKHVVISLVACFIKVYSFSAAERNVRLVDRYDKDLVSEGFVLVYINGTWGTICDVAWGRADSEVTCFELGFSGAVLIDDHSYKPHPDNILFDVRCVGNETTILDCPSSDVDVEGGDCWAPAKAYAFCTNYTSKTIWLPIYTVSSVMKEMRIILFNAEGYSLNKLSDSL